MRCSKRLESCCELYCWSQLRSCHCSAFNVLVEVDCSSHLLTLGCCWFTRLEVYTAKFDFSTSFGRSPTRSLAGCLSSCFGVSSRTSCLSRCQEVKVWSFIVWTDFWLKVFSDCLCCCWLVDTIYLDHLPSCYLNCYAMHDSSSSTQSCFEDTRID